MMQKYAQELYSSIMWSDFVPGDKSQSFVGICSSKIFLFLIGLKLIFVFEIEE